jgi:hypothetical protein
MSGKNSSANEQQQQQSSCSSCSIKYNGLPEFTMIDLPFFATSTAAAYSTLGGEEATKNILRDDMKSMSLKFPSTNALQGSLVGEKVTTGGGLLLKIRRKKITDENQQNAQQNVVIEVLGRVDSAYIFNQPADYQVRNRGKYVKW